MEVDFLHGLILGVVSVSLNFGLKLRSRRFYVLRVVID